MNSIVRVAVVFLLSCWLGMSASKADQQQSSVKCRQFVASGISESPLACAVDDSVPVGGTVPREARSGIGSTTRAILRLFRSISGLKSAQSRQRNTLTSTP